MKERCPCTGANLDRLVQPAVLVSLSKQELHGYGLAKTLGEMPVFDGRKPDTTGLYRALKEMERRGLILSFVAPSAEGPESRVYRITPLGQSCLARWADTLERYGRGLASLLDEVHAVAPKGANLNEWTHPDHDGPCRIPTSACSHPLQSKGSRDRGRNIALFFPMGMYKAAIPRTLSYSKDHLWVGRRRPGVYRFGLTAYLVRLLSDVVCVTWSVQPETSVAKGQAVAHLESAKATLEIYAPISGKVLALNEQAVTEPSTVTLDPYAAWLIEMQGDAAALLTSEAYLGYLRDCWSRDARS